MKLGIIIEPNNHGSVADNYDGMLELITEVENKGFASVWIDGHEFSLAAAVAEVTESIRVGLLTKPALIHPMKTAEDAAVLDLMSNGRLLFGADSVASSEEMATGAIKHEEAWPRFREAMDVITKAWSHDGFAYQGDFYRIPLRTTVASDDGQPFTTEPSEPPFVQPWQRAGMPFEYVSLQPKPLQIPHPPVFVSAHNEEISRWAARMGYSLILRSRLEDAGSLSSVYWEELARSGRRREEVSLAIVADVHVVDEVVDDVDDKTTGSTDLSGSPDRVLRDIKALVRDTGAFHLLCRIRGEMPTQETTLRSLHLLASEIRPNLEM